MGLFVLCAGRRGDNDGGPDSRRGRRVHVSHHTGDVIGRVRLRLDGAPAGRMGSGRGVRRPRIAVRRTF